MRLDIDHDLNTTTMIDKQGNAVHKWRFPAQSDRLSCDTALADISDMLRHAPHWFTQELIARVLQETR